MGYLRWVPTLTGEKMEITFSPTGDRTPAICVTRQHSTIHYKSRLVPQGSTSVIYTYPVTYIIGKGNHNMDKQTGPSCSKRR